MDWQRDGANWPNRARSSFVTVGPTNWHVQRMGQGPLLLLAHGTGAATHSWRDFMPELASHFTVLAVDLPGHGFTTGTPRHRLTLPGMADSLSALLAALGEKPVLAIGHSAGAAILARIILDGGAAPAGLIALNGAMLPLPGLPGHFFSSMAKMLVMLPAVPRFFTWRASDPAAVRNLMIGTGSHIDQAGLDHYAMLLRDSDHVGNVLAMMANWDLDPLARDLPRLAPPLVLITAEGDKAVPLKVGRKIAALVPGARIVLQPKLGHLSHEEAPAETAALIVQIARDLRVIAT